MMLVELSNDEKKLLEFLYKGDYESINECNVKNLYACCKRLEALGFVSGAYLEGEQVLDIKLKSKGKNYIEENPILDNPIDENEIKKLQLKELEYKDRIRGMEKVILTWKLISAICGILAFAFAILLAISK